MTHKRNLKKSTRIDEENKNNATGIFFVKTVRDFKDLTVTVESELECEILTTGNSRCYLKIGTGMTQKQ